MSSRRKLNNRQSLCGTNVNTQMFICLDLFVFTFLITSKKRKTTI